MDNPIRQIVIVGGGTSGWMTAALLAHVVGKSHKITLIESEEIGTVGVGEATIPPLIQYNNVLGIDEDDFLRATKGTIKLGIEFENWLRPGHRYMHAFGSFGRQLGLVHFQLHWLRGRRMGVAQDWEQYILNTVAARSLRFARPGGPRRSPLDPLAYAFHFDAALYARYLRNYSEQRGVVRCEGKITRVVQRPLDGFIDHVEMQDGTKVGSDLFVDCSGFRGLLIEETLKTGFEDWSEWLPCNRAWAVPCVSGGEFTPYTRSTARDAGWQWRIPLQHRIGNGYVYCNRFISDDEAAATLLANLDGKPEADPRQLRFTAGRRKKLWNKNVVAVGLAGGFLEPLESTSIHLVQSGALRLLQILPNERFDQAEIDEFNRISALEYERVRDFIILHYKATERDDTPFWRECKDREVPPELKRRMDYFRAHGRISRDIDELFTEVSWVEVMLGQGIMPQGYNPLADQMNDADLKGFLDEVRAMIDHEIKAMPLHADFIAQRTRG